MHLQALATFTTGYQTSALEAYRSLNRLIDLRPLNLISVVKVNNQLKLFDSFVMSG